MAATEPPNKPKPVNAPGRHATQRFIPPPWIDCPVFGWRHYPDSSIRHGPKIGSACSNRGQQLPPQQERNAPTP